MRTGWSIVAARFVKVSHGRRAISDERMEGQSGGQIRPIEEAVEIARSYGVVIPDDVEFHVDEAGELHKDLTARVPRVDKPSGERVYWSDLVHDLTNKGPIQGLAWHTEERRSHRGRARARDARAPDLAPAARRVTAISIDDLILHTEPGRPGNLHGQAWDVADRMVDQMRGGSAQ